VNPIGGATATATKKFDDPTNLAQLTGLRWFPAVGTTPGFLVLSNIGNSGGFLLSYDGTATTPGTYRTLSGSVLPWGNAVQASGDGGTPKLVTSYTQVGAASTGKIVVGDSSATPTDFSGVADTFNSPGYLAYVTTGANTRLYVSDGRYQRQTLGNAIFVYNGSVRTVGSAVGSAVSDDERPNGIVGSNDGNSLFVVTNPGPVAAGGATVNVRKYAIGTGGALTPDTTPFIAVSGATLGDGIAIDDGGNLYVAVSKSTGATTYAPAVFVYGPTGTKLGEISFPGALTGIDAAVSLAFGQADRKTLYISLYKGHDAPGPGALYSFVTGCAGKL
jgi:sugar lactone lactonase YvrE